MKTKTTTTTKKKRSPWTQVAPAVYRRETKDGPIFRASLPRKNRKEGQGTREWRAAGSLTAAKEMVAAANGGKTKVAKVKTARGKPKPTTNGNGKAEAA